MSRPSFQVVACGRGFLFLFPDRFTDGFRAEALDIWEKQFPGVPAMFVEYAKLVQLGDAIPMFEFSGDIAPEKLDEFRKWWEEAARWPEGITSGSSTGPESG